MEKIESITEDRQVALLGTLALWDASSEPVFDLIAKAARDATLTDASFISFVDGHGLLGNVAAGGGSEPACLRAVLSERVARSALPLVITDVERDFQGSASDVGAYAGFPIFVQEMTVGVLCVTSAAQRSFSDNQLAQVETLAQIAGQSLGSRREQLFLSQLFGGTSDAVIIVDERQTIRHWNAAAEAIFGISSDDALGQSLRMIIPERLRAGHDRGFARLCLGGRPTLSGAVEVPALRRDGAEFPASLALSVWRDSERTMIGAIIRDISEREALNQVRVASEAKTRFLANMSHEIRTPLNGIIGLADVLSRTPLAQDQTDLLGAITGAARTLEGLLSDVLDLARLEEGALRIVCEPFDLLSLSREVSALHRPRAEAKGLACILVQPEGECWVAGDQMRLRQVLGNLLSNAVKFTHEGSIRLELAREGQTWRFTVSDSGIGFDEQAKARIFDRFTQADDSITRQYGGSGLGLSICVDLVRAMGGELSAISTPGQGASFSFRLALPDAQARVAAAEPSPVQESGLKVLLAEDHAINRKVIELILQEVGAQVVAVGDGREATTAYGAEPFDLILMDMQMPFMDGLSATREIRGLERRLGRSPCPVIMLTANVMPEHLRASFEAGADRHLGKPIEAARLLAAINEVLSGSQVPIR
ncbi:hybrid sensor histidine kinase/response regulator [Caulobacter zeae]|uniref:hybrid sensor histidine kinase/response regulator n=1 Tax=Caulobacter zeae TaxID=2055137 RepID=UPI0013FD14E6|nr:ATP-binding protein [Caulobacter zeae]